MKNDPFAQLSGLDQRLFAPHSPATQVRQEKTGGEGRQKTVAPKERPDGRSDVRNFRAPSGGTKGRTLSRSFEPTEERPTERRPYDFYADQVRWLNKMKVVVEERYRRKITANAMVQMALDLLIQDYRAKGKQSQLIRALVFGEPVPEHPEQGKEEEPDGSTDERPDEES